MTILKKFIHFGVAQLGTFRDKKKGLCRYRLFPRKTPKNCKKSRKKELCRYRLLVWNCLGMETPLWMLPFPRIRCIKDVFCIMEKQESTVTYVPAGTESIEMPERTDFLLERMSDRLKEIYPHLRDFVKFIESSIDVDVSI